MWISVHDTVDCSKLRKLARLAGCSKGEALGVLTAIWLWGAKNADQDGLIRDSSEDDIAYVAFPYLSKGVNSDDFVEKMIESGWIERIDGELYFHDWEDWQAQWYKYQREKARDTERRRKLRQARKKGTGEAPGCQPEEEPKEPTTELPEAEETVQKPEKAAAPKKPKPEKKRYAEFVTMCENDYEKLVDQYGEEAVKKMIEVLDNYKGQSGKKYKDDYRAILNWVWKRVRDENPGLMKARERPPQETGGLFDIIPDEWRNGRG